MAPAPCLPPLAAQAQAQAQAHPQPAVTLQAVTLRVALGVSGAERAGVLPAAFPGSARRGHQRDRQGSGLSRPGCLRGGVGFAPTQLPSASAEPGSACSSTGAQQAASPAPGPPRLHPCAPSWQALGSLDPPTPGEQPPDSAPRCRPLLLLPEVEDWSHVGGQSQGPLPFAGSHREGVLGAGGSSATYQPLKMANLHPFANSRAICVEMGSKLLPETNPLPPLRPPAPRLPGSDPVRARTPAGPGWPS